MNWLICITNNSPKTSITHFSHKCTRFMLSSIQRVLNTTSIKLWTYCKYNKECNNESYHTIYLVRYWDTPSTLITKVHTLVTHCIHGIQTIFSSNFEKEILWFFLLHEHCKIYYSNTRVYIFTTTKLDTSFHLVVLYGNAWKFYSCIQLNLLHALHLHWNKFLQTIEFQLGN